MRSPKEVGRVSGINRNENDVPPLENRVGERLHGPVGHGVAKSFHLRHCPMRLQPVRYGQLMGRITSGAQGQR